LGNIQNNKAKSKHNIPEIIYKMEGIPPTEPAINIPTEIVSEPVANQAQLTQSINNVPPPLPLNKRKTKNEYPRFGKHFGLRACIAIFIYWQTFMKASLAFWQPFIAFAESNTFLGSWLASFNDGTAERQHIIKMASINNVIYFVLTIIMLLIFLPEIIKAMEHLKKEFWLVSYIPLAYIANIFIAITIMVIAESFVDLPSTSINQESIEAVQNLSIWANAFPTLIGAPIVEEIIFRLAFASGLFALLTKIFNASESEKSWKKIAIVLLCIVVVSVSFAGIHVIDGGDYLAIFPYIAAGISFTSLYFISKQNIVVTILFHFVFNLIATLV